MFNFAFSAPTKKHHPKNTQKQKNISLPLWLSHQTNQGEVGRSGRLAVEFTRPSVVSLVKEEIPTLQSGQAPGGHHTVAPATITGMVVKGMRIVRYFGGVGT